jgi:hypothetical protein
MAKRFIGNVKGVGISKIEREYYLSSSGTEPLDGEWITTVPTLGDNKYLWSRDKITLTDNTIQTTSPICDGVWEEIYRIYEIGENITELKNNSFELNPTQTIPSNADLNDYTDFGCWLCPSTAVSKTLKNCPLDNQGFSLRVMRGTSNAYRVQEIIAGLGGRIYRHYTGTTWSKWITDADAAISAETIQMFEDAGYPIE